MTVYDHTLLLLPLPRPMSASVCANVLGGLVLFCLIYVSIVTDEAALQPKPNFEEIIINPPLPAKMEADRHHM